MDFIDVIKIKYDKLTVSEQRIADYILRKSDDFLISNAQEIGEKTQTSGATVVRFCKKLGFTGLENLKVVVAKSDIHLKEDTKIDPIIQSDDTDEMLVNKIYSHVETSLMRTIDLIDFKMLEQIIQVIKNAKKVYMYGIGASSLSAYDLYHKFNRIDKQTFYGFDGHMNIEFSVHSKPDDVAIAISYGGDSKEIILAVKRLKLNKTPVVAIVKEGESALSQIADYCLYVPNTEKQVKMGALSSKFSQSLLADILYFGVVKEDLNSIFNQLEKTNQVVQPLKEKK